MSVRPGTVYYLRHCNILCIRCKVQFSYVFFTAMTLLVLFGLLFSSPPQNIFLQACFYAILVPTVPFAPQIQRGFPVDIVHNTNLLT